MWTWLLIGWVTASIPLSLLFARAMQPFRRDDGHSALRPATELTSGVADHFPAAPNTAIVSPAYR
jgi:hypothetical protein